LAYEKQTEIDYEAWKTTLPATPGE
jgi:hypothetical protein